MSECTRFEDEGLLKLVNGEPLDSHFEHCQECLAAYEKYIKITASLVDLDSKATPQTNWQDNVLKEIGQPNVVSRHPRGLVWISSLAAGVVAAALLLNVYKVEDTELELKMAVERGDVVYRGDAVNIGDVLRIEAQIPGSAQAQLRLYRGSQRVLFSCSEEPPCVKSEDGISAAFHLVSIGSYRSAVLTSSDPLPNATGNLDEDVRVARERGATVIVSQPIDVQ